MAKWYRIKELLKKDKSILIIRVFGLYILFEAVKFVNLTRFMISSSHEESMRVNYFEAKQRQNTRYRCWSSVNKITVK